MELQGLQLFEDFFEGSKAALLLEGSAEQLDEHDMFADGQNDLRHQHFVVLGPAAVRIDLFGKRKESAQRQLVLRVGETQRGVLGRHTGPRGEEEPDAGPHEIFQNVGVGQRGRRAVCGCGTDSGRIAKRRRGLTAKRRRGPTAKRRRSPVAKHRRGTAAKCRRSPAALRHHLRERPVVMRRVKVVDDQEHP